MCFHLSGLEDQLLAQVVAAERPELETAKNQLIVSNAKMKQELKEIEDEILFRLSSSEGNPVDNQELIQVLEASKVKAGEIQVRQRGFYFFEGVYQSDSDPLDLLMSSIIRVVRPKCW